MSGTGTKRKYAATTGNVANKKSQPANTMDISSTSKATAPTGRVYVNPAKGGKKEEAELKYIDTSQSDAPADVYAANVNGAAQNSHVFCLPVATGTGPSDRIGRSITLKSVSINALVKPNPVADVAGAGNQSLSSSVRVIVYLDHGSNASASLPNVGTILKALGPGVADPVSSLSFMNEDYKGRFTFLIDEIMPVGQVRFQPLAPAFGFVLGPNVNGLSVTRKIDNQKATFSGTAGLIDNVVTNSINVLVLGSQPSTTTPTIRRVPLVDWATRVEYIDQ